jgi:signal transduction histidine kinase
MDSRVKELTFPVGAFRRRIAWVFGLQLLIGAIVCALGVYSHIPILPLLAVIVITAFIAWLVIRREWRPVRALAQVVNRWDGHKPEPDALDLDRLSLDTDADVASLARGLHGFATRIADYNQRERNFTRDASHELRSPLTVIKMSVDMLAEEEGMSDFGTRSIHRIKRATREMEVLVEALLLLARESDASDSERFVVNDLLRKQMVSARELMAGRPIELLLEESARFAVQGSTLALSVLCWQLIRNACQQTEQGNVVVAVMPGMVSVSNHALADDTTRPWRVPGADRHGFELAIAKRISDRFGWPLDLETHIGVGNVACIRFPQVLPVDAAGRS